MAKLRKSKRKKKSSTSSAASASKIDDYEIVKEYGYDPNDIKAFDRAFRAAEKAFQKQ